MACGLDAVNSGVDLIPCTTLSYEVITEHFSSDLLCNRRGHDSRGATLSALWICRSSCCTRPGAQRSVPTKRHDSWMLFMLVFPCRTIWYFSILLITCLSFDQDGRLLVVDVLFLMACSWLGSYLLPRILYPFQTSAQRDKTVFLRESIALGIWIAFSVSFLLLMWTIVHMHF